MEAEDVDGFSVWDQFCLTTRQIFREADADDSGDLDREELRIALRTLAPSSCR